MVVLPAIRSLGVLLLVAIAVAPVSAQDPEWGAKMLDLTELKFGSVAKGADAALRVRVKNVYKEDIQITNATTGCGCVSWDEKSFPIVVPSGREIALTLRLDTIRYDGERKSKATLALFEPTHNSANQVTLPVEAYIRRDIVVTPGSVNFGAVDLGKGAQQRVTINYAGRSDWKIVQAKAGNSKLTADLVEKNRENGLVGYELLVTLKPETPAGNLRDQITLVTDDVNNPQIPVLVEARIEADIVVTEVQFGSIAVGQSKTMNAIIRGKKPFKIEKIERTKADESFKVKSPQATATVHSLPLTFTAPGEVGPFEEEFFITISGREQPVTFKARGRIVDPTTSN